LTTVHEVEVEAYSVKERTLPVLLAIDVMAGVLQRVKERTVTVVLAVVWMAGVLQRA